MQVRIYAVSMMAFAPLQDPSIEGQSTLTYHTVAVFPATNIKEAADKAQAHCFNLWNPVEGWYAHQAAVLPVTKEFCDLAVAALNESGINLTDPPEQEQIFQFDPQTL